jgi:Ti-type conjugative transfer relaxase TraA
MRVLKRSAGDNAFRTNLYNRRDQGVCGRTGKEFCYAERGKPVHHAVLLPAGAKAEFADSDVLWNAVEAAERRKDSQVAWELVLALPASDEVSGEDHVALTHSFVNEHFVSKGVAAQVDIHAPDEEGGVNWHAHLLITTRRVGPDGLSRTKARDLEPVVRWVGGRRQVVDAEAWGQVWGAHLNRYFVEQAMATRVDANSVLGQVHIEPYRMRREGSWILKHAEERRLANIEAARDPRFVLEALTRTNATFTEADLDRFLAKQLGGSGVARSEIALIRSAVLESPEVLALYDSETEEASRRMTTREVREQELAALAIADELSSRSSGAVTARSAQRALAGESLNKGQAKAFVHATGAGHLKLIEGRAGTGKSYTLNVMRDAFERDGKRVVGLAPTNVVAQDMAAAGFGEEARTVHSALFRIENGRDRWDANTVVMVDEASMIDTRITCELLSKVHSAGAKLILVGDDRQLSSIERGGVFSELLKRFETAEITKVMRQEVDWQREAARDLAQYRFGDAVDAFDRAGAIHWSDKQSEAMSALVAAWARDLDASRATPDADESRFVFAYTNRDVDALNLELRAVCRDRGLLSGADVPLAILCRASDDDEEEERIAHFAKGDRVQFTKTNKSDAIYNGNLGTITAIDPTTGTVTATLDAAAGRKGREVTWNAHQFKGFRHGYAGTVHKGQGKTLDRTYLYHSRHWKAAASYVALTRQRKDAALFVARETAPDAKRLAQQMAATEIRMASVAWATKDDLVRRAALREQARQRAPADRAGAVKPEPDQTVAVPPPEVVKSDPGPGDKGATEPIANLPSDFVVKPEPDGEPRRARLREDDEARRLAAAQPAQQTLDLIATWDRLIEHYRTQLPGLDHSPDYDKARNHLEEFGKALAGQPAQLAALRTFDAKLRLDQRPALQRIVNSHDPARETIALIHDAEQQQRHQGGNRDSTDLNSPEDARAQLRRRPRDPRSRGR